MIETPWGPLAVADAHVHFFSHWFFASLAEQKGVPDVYKRQDVVARGEWAITLDPATQRLRDRLWTEIKAA